MEINAKYLFLIHKYTGMWEVISCILLATFYAYNLIISIVTLSDFMELYVVT